MSGTQLAVARHAGPRRLPWLRRWRRRWDRHHGGRALAVAAAGAVLAAGLFCCYLLQSRTVAVGSDGASQALQGWELLQGHLLLRGWWMTDVSFYPTELIQYALLELARGLSPDVIHLAGAMTYTLLVLAAALLARGRARGQAGLARGLLAAGLMLAPQLGAGTQTLVLSPDHTGTSVPLLLIFLLIDRTPWAGPPGAGAGAGASASTRAGASASANATRAAWARAARWLVPALVFLGLTLTALADSLTVFVAVIPLTAVIAIRAARGAEPATVPAPTAAVPGLWREAPLAVAALLAIPAGLALAALIRALGGWRVNGLSTALADAGQLTGNARLTGEGLLELFGADPFGAAGAVATALAIAHLAGVALAAAGVAAAARRFLSRRADLIESVLLAGIVVDLAAYLAGVQAVDILSTREIAPVLPFAAVLAGRRLGPHLVSPGTAPASSTALRAARLRPAARAGLYGLLAVYAAGLGYAAAQPPAPAQFAGLAGYLRAHHLTAGLSGYHQANIVTLASGGAVTLRAVTTAPGGRLAAYTWNASTAWYAPGTATATFLVLAEPGTPGPSRAQAVATFGRPAGRYRYQGYTILTWPHGENLLARLSPDQSAGGTDSK